MGKYIGIDLGTTFSCMAYVDENGQSVIIPNSEGGRITPSVVLFDDEDTIVGADAKKQSVLLSESCAQFIKRHMAERDFLFENESGEKYTPEEISAIILKKLKNDAESFLGESVDGAVITVPAYFNDSQRQATKDAGRIAGLNVIGVINEPTAAALAFGITRRAEDNQTIMVYDLGGGTFDVTLMRYSDDKFEVLATSGDRRFGGCDFDDRIVAEAIKAAKAQGFDLESDPDIRQELQLQAENAKITLTTAQKATIVLKPNGKKFKFVITRDEFEDCVDGLLARMISTMEIACDDAGIEYSDIDKILLVGGSTRMPMVSEAIIDETGITPSSEVHPDEAVAIGAAYYVVDILRKHVEKKATTQERKKTTLEIGNRAAEGTTQVVQEAMVLPDLKPEDIPDTAKKITFSDVTSHGVGVICQDRNNNKYNSVILPANTTVPASMTERYYTSRAYQETLCIQITQGEDEDVRYVSIIGESTIEIEPRQEIVNILVSISCDENSIIHVKVFDESAGRDLGEMFIERVSNLTKKEIEEKERRINRLDISGV